MSRVGILGARSALLWAIVWNVARQSLGHEPTVEEVAEWWKSSVRTAYREQARFREAFPELDSPAAIFDAPETKARVDAILGSEGIFGRKSRRESPPETAVLKIGMLPASL